MVILMSDYTYSEIENANLEELENLKEECKERIYRNERYLELIDIRQNMLRKRR